VKGLIFRTRGPDRDRKTDRLRLEATQSAMDRTLQEIRTEKEGLRTRYARFSDSAAFAAVAVENGAGGSAEKKLGDLTASITASSERLSRLEDQEKFFFSLAEQLGQFSKS
jgi:hypothetical protein